MARPKAGKSLLMIDYAASVALGETFLDKATKQGPAIYVPAEDHFRLVRERINTRVSSDRSSQLTVLPVDGSLDQSLRLDSPESLMRLAKTIEDLKPATIILEPFRELHRGKENDADEMSGILRPLRQLAHETNTTIILVHYRNKHASDPSLATRGSSAITGSVDVIMTIGLSGEDDAEFTPDQTMKILVEGRYGPRKRLGARLRSGLRWESTDPRIGDELTADELSELLKTQKKTIQNAVKPLVDRGHVMRIGSGSKGDPFRYTMAQKGLRDESGTNVSASESAKQAIRPAAEGYTWLPGGIKTEQLRRACKECGANEYYLFDGRFRCVFCHLPGKEAVA